MMLFVSLPHASASSLLTCHTFNAGRWTVLRFFKKSEFASPEIKDDSKICLPLLRSKTYVINAIDPRKLLGKVGEHSPLILSMKLNATTESKGKGCNAESLHHFMNLRTGPARECSVEELFGVKASSKASMSKI